MKSIVTISRILLGLIFVVFGLNGFLHFIPTHQFRGVAGQFIGAILTSHFLYRRISDSDRQWFALARKQIRPVGAASSRTGDRQHSWLSHFHVHNESPARACSHCALVDCVLPGAQCLLWCVCREGSVGGQTRSGGQSRVHCGSASTLTQQRLGNGNQLGRPRYSVEEIFRKAVIGRKHQMFISLQLSDSRRNGAP